MSMSKLMLAVLMALLVGCGSEGSPVAQPSASSPARSASPPAPDFTAPPGYRAAYVPAAWVVESVAADRRSAVVRVAGGGCESYGRYDIRDDQSLHLDVWSKVTVPVEDGYGCASNFTAQPVRVDLPRKLAADEDLRGGCDDNPRQEGCGGLSTFRK